MNLKEAFRYQSFLDKLFSEAAAHVQCAENARTVTRTHCLSKANPDAEDYVETVERRTEFDVMDIMRFAVRLIDEKSKLTDGIDYAKKFTAIDIDEAVSVNKYRHKLVDSMRLMLTFKPSERTVRGTDYLLNKIDGNQVQYYYNIIERSEAAFDRPAVRELVGKLSADADRDSAEIDRVMITTAVLYEPPFDVNGTFSDAMEKFLCMASDEAQET